MSKVEYSLTEYGGSLKRALQAICDWGRIHMERINAVEKAPQVLLKGYMTGQKPLHESAQRLVMRSFNHKVKMIRHQREGKKLNWVARLC